MSETKPTLLEGFCVVAEAHDKARSVGMGTTETLSLNHRDAVALAGDFRALQGRIADECRIAQALREELQAANLRADRLQAELAETKEALGATPVLTVPYESCSLAHIERLGREWAALNHAGEFGPLTILEPGASFHTVGPDGYIRIVLERATIFNATMGDDTNGSKWDEYGISTPMIVVGKVADQNLPNAVANQIADECLRNTLAYENLGLFDRAADPDGWIKWNGGECPVDKATRVSVRIRGGKSWDDIRASSYRWFHSGTVGDIIAYRLTKPAPAPLPIDPDGYHPADTKPPLPGVYAIKHIRIGEGFSLWNGELWGHHSASVEQALNRRSPHETAHQNKRWKYL